jgi:hypothetical protein
MAIAVMPYEPGDRMDTRHGFTLRHDLALPYSGERVGPAAPTASVCRDGNRGSASIRYAVAAKNPAFAAATQGYGTDQTNFSGGGRRGFVVSSLAMRAMV